MVWGFFCFCFMSWGFFHFVVDFSFYVEPGLEFLDEKHARLNADNLEMRTGASSCLS